MSISNKLGVTLVTASLLAAAMPSLAAETGDWKRGRLYYRMVCTACHKDMANKSISPMSRTMAEWKAYVVADKHDLSGKSNPSLKYYVSSEYRQLIKETNRAAEKYLDVPQAVLLGDVRAWVVHGAKDSDTPARCQ